MRSFPGVAGVWLSSLLLCFSAALSQGLYPVSIDQKITGSTVIVEGKVIGQKSAWNEQHTMIFTANQVEVYKVFKGSVTKNTIEIITIGGSVDGHLIQATHLLELKKNDVGVFFCRPQYQTKSPAAFAAAFEVYSSAQGFLKYDLFSKSASAPFVHYDEIEKMLYKELKTKTGREPLIKNTTFSISQTTPKFQSNNSTLAPTISSFSPATVNAGALLDPVNNVITIQGSGFGSSPSGQAAVLFSHADFSPGTQFTEVEYFSELIVSWSNTQIKVKVPTQAGSGPFRVRDNAGNVVTSPSNLNVLYSILTADFGDPYGIKQFTLGNMNGSGGYSVKYCTSTANSGTNINTSAAKQTFQRALNTWKETVGLNFAEAGNTSLQVVNPDDGENIIEYDNGGTGLGPLADGVLATCFSGITICTNDPAVNQARKSGFDIVIRNTGYSLGNTPFTLGPCPPLSEFSSVVDLETVLLHELGHALNLGHIVDPLQGSGAGTATPGKVMHFSIAYNQRRISLDFAAKAGALYQITPHDFLYGNCVIGDPEMTPIEVVLETEDECPSTFPISTMPMFTTVNVDLAHSTSNKFADPAYNQWKLDGTGSNVTNTAYYAFKTNESGGTLEMAVSNYATSPVEIAACPVGGSGAAPTGVKISIYKVSSCPTGGSYPVPQYYQTFKADGVLADFNGLTANATYLIAFDGIQNTKAVFDIEFSGTALPVLSTDLSGQVVGDHNELSWTTDPSFDVTSMVLERSDDGVVFVDLQEIIGEEEQQSGQYVDANPLPGTNYYRMRVQSSTGSIQYSEVVSLNQSASGFEVTVYPNPADNRIRLSILSNDFGNYNAAIFNSLGQQVFVKQFIVSTRKHVEVLNVTNLMRGTYFVSVFGKDGKKIKSSAVVIK
jgi:hypothetical protein